MKLVSTLVCKSKFFLLSTNQSKNKFTGRYLEKNIECRNGQKQSPERPANLDSAEQSRPVARSYSDNDANSNDFWKNRKSNSQSNELNYQQYNSQISNRQGSNQSGRSGSQYDNKQASNTNGMQPNSSPNDQRQQGILDPLNGIYNAVNSFNPFNNRQKPQQSTSQPNYPVSNNQQSNYQANNQQLQTAFSPGQQPNRLDADQSNGILNRPLWPNNLMNPSNVQQSQRSFFPNSQALNSQNQINKTVSSSSMLPDLKPIADKISSSLINMNPISNSNGNQPQKQEPSSLLSSNFNVSNNFDKSAISFFK